MAHKITLLETVELTPDTRHYIFTRPDGYSFTPGQATDFALDRDGWRDEERPFTFTGDPDAPVLCFTIKSYPDHEGVTRELWSATPGCTALIGDPWGAIEDKGPGVFIAGGAGITPFLGILKKRARAGTLEDATLIFANTSPKDIILRPLWDGLDGLKTVYATTKPAEDIDYDRITTELLEKEISDWTQHFYVCGPPAMEDEIVGILTDKGVSEDQIIREE